MTQFVAADAQFGTVKLLRPYEGAVIANGGGDYEGQSSLQPIMLTNEGVGPDPLSGEAGYNVDLIAATQVPLGSRVILYLPAITSNSGLFYQYTIAWRFRNLEDFQQAGGPYHYPSDTENSFNEVIKPAFFHSIQYNQTEPATGYAQATLFPLQITAEIGGVAFAPIVRPKGSTVPAAGVVQQLLTSGGGVPGFLPWEGRALGDELLLGVTRDPSGGTWDFSAGEDTSFSRLFGVPQFGVYMLTGAASP